MVGLYLRSVPGKKAHAVCKMHQITCAVILGWKMVAQLISRHGPDFVLFFSFLCADYIYVCMYSKFCVIFIVVFWQTEAAPAAPKNTFYESFKKRPAAGATFECLDRRQKRNWFHQSDSHIKIDATHFFLFLFCYLLFFICSSFIFS